jgi:hypothetical protein
MLFLEGGWRTPEEFVRDVYEAIMVGCNDESTQQLTIGLLREKFKDVTEE